MGTLTDQTERWGRQADSSDWLDHAVRAGLVAYGVVHLLIAWLALQLALGDREGSTTSTGAMHELAQQPFGGVLVWAVAVGMVLLVVWRLLEATTGHRSADGGELVRKRLTSLGKAVIYGVIGFSAVRVASGSGGSGGSGGQGKGGSGSDGMTARVLQWPGGQWIVAAVGLAVIGYGVHHLVRAWTEKFAENLTSEGRSGDSGTAYVWFGKVGYAAKGLAIGIVGGLFCYAAVTHDAQKSGGLDQALQKVLQQPYGPVLLSLMALGIGCYGLFSFARARHLSR